MKESTKILVIGGLAIAAVSVVGFLMLRKPKEEPTSNSGNVNEGTTPSEMTEEQKNALVSANLALTNPFAALFVNSGSGTASKQIYQVKTLGGNLNIRKTPSSSGVLVKKVANGSSLFGKPSKNAGWFEVSEDGKSNIGFASSVYLVKK